MNVLEAYILQKKKLTIVISSLDILLLKEIGKNLSIDLNAKLIDLTDYMIVRNLGDINNNTIHEKNTKENVRIIICPFYPEQIFSNYRINYHINISLNNELLEKKQIDHKLIDLYKEISSYIRVNKYLNLHKYKDNLALEDEIFNLIIEFINKKLDDGEYLDKIKNIHKKEYETETDEYKKMENNSLNNKIDNDIIEEIELSSVEPLSDSSISEIIIDDINMDDELYPTRTFSDDSAFANTHYIKGSRILKKKINNLNESIPNYLYKIVNNNEINGNRELKLKLN